jgi:hypothetical protein
MKRREFLKYGAGGIAALVVGKAIPGMFGDEAYAQVPVTELNFTITDALKNMVTHNDINQAQCYFWIYKEASLPADCPGPHIFVIRGERVGVTIKNDLDEPHSFFIPGMFDSGPIAPGATFTGSFIAKTAGTHLYYDNLNEPVNRVMGLHGALIVMPRVGPIRNAGNQVGPYENPTPAVQSLFNDLGTKPWWPGLSWEKADRKTKTPGFRQYIWLLHQASPNLFAEVGNLPAGQLYSPQEFVRAFLRDPFSPTGNNRIPQYFTISGQSGHFSHNNPYNNPNHRVGEPVVIRILNAGLWTHSMHLHANHYYLIGNNGPQENVLWLDVFTVKPMDIQEWLIPYMRPPDVPNKRGIGRADPALVSRGLTMGPHPCWPPIEELNTVLPDGLKAGAIDLSTQLSPLCYPMHDHSEPTQTAQGGNYNLGTIAGMNFIGDRNVEGGVYDFPHQPLVHGPGPKGKFPPTVGPPWF